MCPIAKQKVVEETTLVRSAEIHFDKWNVPTKTEKAFGIT